MKMLRRISQRDWLVVGVPIVALLVVGFWFAAQFVKPAPPDVLVMTTGSEGGAYQSYAARYKAALAEYGIRLVEKPSAGSAENLQRLNDPAFEVDVGFVQGGSTNLPDDFALESLGSAYYEPLWVFYRGRPGLSRLEELAGKRIAVGQPGSGTYKLAMDLLESHNLAVGRATLVSESGFAAVAALQAGKVDAVFLVGPPRSGTVWTLLHTEGVALMSFSQADAYIRRFPYLARVTLPRGVINFERDIPHHDVTLVSPVATVVVRKDTHPALVDLLLQVMAREHRSPDILQKMGEFPSAKQVDFPLNPRAERFYQSGPPLLQRYLPFWLANLVDRTVVMLVPVIALLLPLIKITPPLYTWRVRSRIYRWYGQLKFLEYEAEHHPENRSRAEWEEAVDRIERAVNRMPTPLSFSEHVYTLRSHVAMVREAIARRTQHQGDDHRPPS
ncbi:MAG: TAXI family TRAP transporter solute-binding subunit [Rhodocyclaceae bacterium]